MGNDREAVVAEALDNLDDATFAGIVQEEASAAAPKDALAKQAEATPADGSKIEPESSATGAFTEEELGVLPTAIQDKILDLVEGKQADFTEEELASLPEGKRQKIKALQEANAQDDGGADAEELSEAEILALPEKQQKAYRRLLAERGEARSALEQQRRQQAGTDRKLSEVSQKLEAASTAVQERQANHQAQLQVYDNRYKEYRGNRLGDEQDLRDRISILRNQARDLVEVDPMESKRLAMEASSLLLQADGISSQLRMDAEAYESIREKTVRDYSLEMEEAFLKSKDEAQKPNSYREVQGKFAGFCQELSQRMGIKADSIMQNPDSIEYAYNLLLNAERGKPENFDRIRKRLSTALQDREQRLKALKPLPASSSTERGRGKRRVEDGLDFLDE